MAHDGVLFFLCLNDRGGAELSMLKIACGLAARGRTVTLAVYGAMPGLARQAGFRGEVIDLKARRTLTALVPLALLLRARKFAVVVSALTMTNLAAILARALSFRRMPIIATEHGLDDFYRVERNPIFGAWAASAYARAHIVAVSQALATRWQAALASYETDIDVRTLYNPIVDEGSAPVVAPPHAWLAAKDGQVVVAAGRLRPEKDFATLLRAFAKAAATRHLRLIILGEGPERATLENLARKVGIADRVLFPGFQGNIAAWLASADLFVCSSTREGFGNVLVEALAAGVPVVSTDCPFGPREILRDGALGRLTPVGDAESLAKAMVETLAAPPDAAILRARAADFSASHCIDGYLALIDRVSGATKSGRS
jgi:glycosyltransferase involved in cell wall biosynthesis